MKIVQTDSSLYFEQIDTLFISVGGQEGGFGGSFCAGGQNFGHACLQYFYASCVGSSKLVFFSPCNMSPPPPKSSPTAALAVVAANSKKGVATGGHSSY